MAGKPKEERAPVEIVWEPPPEARRRLRSMYDDVLPEIKKTPGRWARIRVVNQGNAHSALQNLRKVTADDDAWEAVARPLNGSTSQYGLWLRYRTAEQIKAVKVKR